MQNARSHPDAGINRRTILTSGAWSVPVIALAAATPAAAASTTPQWIASSWVSRYRTDKQQLTVSFYVDQPFDKIQSYSFSYALAFASDPQNIVSWTPGFPALLPYDQVSSIIDAFGPWASGLPDPATMDGQTLNIVVTATKPDESPMILSGSDEFDYWDND